MSRLHRALTENISIVSMDKDEQNAIFKVVGTRGCMYRVEITETPTCTCPDFKDRGGKCKHILYCFIKGLQCPINSAFFNKTIYTASEIQNAIYNMHQENIDTPIAHPREQECPICYIETKNSNPYSCETCGNSFHWDCIMKWFALKHSCPVCRGENNLFKPHFTLTRQQKTKSWAVYSP